MDCGELMMMQSKTEPKVKVEWWRIQGDSSKPVYLGE
jgi:hypothetical protein